LSEIFYNWEKKISGNNIGGARKCILPLAGGSFVLGCMALLPATVFAQ